MTLDEYKNYLINNLNINEEVINYVTDVYNYNEDTLNNIIYYYTGYQDIEQYTELEDIITYNKYYEEDEEE